MPGKEAKKKGKGKSEEKIERKEQGKEEVEEEKSREAKRFARYPVERREEKIRGWIPKTQLGKRVMNGEFKTIDDVLKSGELILEPEIVDYLIHDLKDDVIYIGGSPGKGGGIRRTATKRTVRMHKSGRRFKLTSVIVVGNENGIVGIAKASAKEHRNAMEKALDQAKTKVIRVKAGCGSWECGCGGKHSIPFKTTARIGSVEVILYPAPKGVGVVASTAAKKILKLAGIKDIWVKTRGQTGTRGNLAFTTFEALKNLNRAKGDL
jgi:small subunit ribosomal protein S5